MKKSTIYKLALGLILALSTSVIYSQVADYYYQSPLNGAKFINPEQTIILKTGNGFDASGLRSGYLKITGSVSGEMDFDMKVSDDMKTLLIIPTKSFAFGERVDVEVYPGMKDGSGQALKEKKFHFYIKKGETLTLLKKYRNSPDCDFYIPESGESDIPLAQPTSGGNNLPLDYPPPTMNFGEDFSPDDNYILMNMVSRQHPLYNLYLTILDCYGTPIFYKRTELSSRDLKVLADGVLTYSNNDPNFPENEKYFLLDSSYVIIDSVMMGNGYNVDGHEMLLLENGHYLLFSYDPQTVDMSQIVPGGNPNATVIGLVIQEVDLDRTVFFQWRSWDHFQITDAVYDISMTAASIDYVHGNAMEIDNDGNILLSCRNMDEITKIDFSTGNIIWRFGLNSENNMFQISNDPVGFSHQHDIRRMSNGHYSVYDNGNNHTPQFSQALEYTINEQNMQANRVYHYQRAGVYAWATGDYRLMDNGKRLICWGTFSPLNVTELNADNSISFDLLLPQAVSSYRAIKQAWKTNLFTSRENLSLGNFSSNKGPKETYLYIHNNSNNSISITSTYNMQEAFYVTTTLPMLLPPNGTKKITVAFNPTQEGSFNDRLTLNYDNIGNSMRIARQVKLSGTWDDSIPYVDFEPSFGTSGFDPDSAIHLIFSEPVKKALGGELNNDDIPQIVKLRLDNYNGELVPITGTISEDKSYVTIYPQNTLLGQQQYYVELRANVIADYDGNVIRNAESTYFTTGMLTGINRRPSRPIEIFPNPFDNKLSVKLDNQGPHQLIIYDLRGQSMLEMHTANRFIKLDTRNLSPGMYMLKIKDDENGITRTFKIVKQSW